MERTHLSLSEISKLDRLTIQLVYLRRRDKDGLLPSTKMPTKTVTEASQKEEFIKKLTSIEVSKEEAEFQWAKSVAQRKEYENYINGEVNHVAKLQKILLPRSSKPFTRRDYSPG